MVLKITKVKTYDLWVKTIGWLEDEGLQDCRFSYLGELLYGQYQALNTEGLCTNRDSMVAGIKDYFQNAS